MSRNAFPFSIGTGNHNFLAAAGRHGTRMREQRLQEEQKRNQEEAQRLHIDYVPPPPIIPRDSFESPLYFIPDQHYNQLETFLWWTRYLIEVVWLAFLLVGTVWKLIDNPLYSFVAYLTNWSWFAQLVFYLLDILSYFDDSGKTTFAIVGTLYWGINGLVWEVFFLMFELLFNNPNILNEFAMQDNVSLGAVYDGDRIYHVLPAVISLAYMYLNRKTIFRAVEIYMGPKSPMAVRVAYGLYASIISPLLLPLFYLCIFNPQVIYGITTSIWVLLGVGGVGLLVFNVIPFIGFVVKCYD